MGDLVPSVPGSPPELKSESWDFVPTAALILAGYRAALREGCAGDRGVTAFPTAACRVRLPRPIRWAAREFVIRGWIGEALKLRFIYYC